MKTAEEILNDHLWMGNKPSIAQESILSAMEEYAAQQPEPQPIEKLFDLKEDCYVWLKHKRGEVEVAKVVAQSGFDVYIEHAGKPINKFWSIQYFQSFIIADIPKF